MKPAKVDTASAHVDRPQPNGRPPRSDSPDEPCVRLYLSRGLPSGKLDAYWLTARQARSVAIELLQAAERADD